MDFFESLPQPPPPQPPKPPPRRPWMRPEAMIPGSVPAEVLLVRTETVAVAVGSIRAYPNGLEFTVHVRQRRADEDFLRGLADPFGRNQRMRGAIDPDQSLRLGILYADGRRAAATGGRQPPPDRVGPGELVVQHAGSRGSDLRWDGDFWVHPLPPDGPVTFVLSWLAKDVAEARAQVDGAAIRAAASRAVELWPGDPDAEPTTAAATSTFISAAAESAAPPAAAESAAPPADPGPEDTSR